MYLVARIIPLKEIYDLNAWNRLKSVQRKCPCELDLEFPRNS